MTDSADEVTRSKLFWQLVHPAVRVASEKGRLATSALIEQCLLECADLLLCHCLAWWVLAAVAFGAAGFLVIIFTLLKCLLNDVFTENFEGIEIIIEDSDMLDSSNISLAARAVQKGEVDALGAPSRTKNVSQALCVQDVSTFKLQRRFFVKFCLANHTIVVYELEVFTRRLKASEV